MRELNSVENIGENLWNSCVVQIHLCYSGYVCSQKGSIYYECRGCGWDLSNLPDFRNWSVSAVLPWCTIKYPCAHADLCLFVHVTLFAFVCYTFVTTIRLFLTVGRKKASLSRNLQAMTVSFGGRFCAVCVCVWVDSVGVIGVTSRQFRRARSAARSRGQVWRCDWWLWDIGGNTHALSLLVSEVARHFPLDLLSVFDPK